MITAWISASATHEVSLGSKIGHLCEFVVLNNRAGKILIDINARNESVPGQIRAILGPPTTTIIAVWQYVKNPKRPEFRWVWDETLQRDVWTMVDAGEPYTQCQVIPGFGLKLAEYLEVAPDLVDSEGNTSRPLVVTQTHNWLGWADKAL